MCCDNSGEQGYAYIKGVLTKLINGECEHCGSDTVDGCSTDICNYSPHICDVCGYSPCDQSC